MQSRRQYGILYTISNTRTEDTVLDRNEWDPESLQETPEQQKEKTVRRRRLRLAGILTFILRNGVVLFFSARADFSKKDLGLSFDLFSARNLFSFTCAVGCVCLALFAEICKYLKMMRQLGERVSPRAAFETVVLGRYYDCITPSGAGGQPFQIYHLHSHGYTGGTKSAMPLASFITTQYAFVILALVLFIFNNNTADVVGIRIAAYVGLLAYSAVPTMVALTAISPALSGRIVGFFVRIGAKLRLVKDPEGTIGKVEGALQRYSGSLRLIAANRSLLLTLFALSLVYQISICSIPFFAVRIFGGRLGYLQSLTMCLYVYASVTIVPTPGNAGAAEGSFYLLFDQLDTSGVFWAMLIWRFLCYYLFILLGLGIYAYRGIERKRRKKQAP